MFQALAGDSRFTDFELSEVGEAFEDREGFVRDPSASDKELLQFLQGRQMLEAGIRNRAIVQVDIDQILEFSYLAKSFIRYFSVRER